MNTKNITALILALVLLVSLSACKNTNDISNQQTTTANSDEPVTDIITNEIPADQVINEDTAQSSSPTESEINTEAKITIDNNSDPSTWTIEQIVDTYKLAATKTSPKVKSQHSILLKKISVNNGKYEGLFDFITPIMAKLLENNSEDKDGITGGYNNLSVSDIASAKAYKIGNNTVIEIVLKEQISGAREDALSGSVGHAITAVGDIGFVTDQLTDLGIPLELSEKDTKIIYTNPTVKVLINNNGEIINGTWKYTVEIKLNNYKAFGKAVDTTSVIMDNILTVNGGFNH